MFRLSKLNLKVYHWIIFIILRMQFWLWKFIFLTNIGSQFNLKRRIVFILLQWQVWGRAPINKINDGTGPGWSAINIDPCLMSSGGGWTNGKGGKWKEIPTVYPKKYAYIMCLVVFCCGLVVTDFNYRQVSNIRRAKSQHLKDSHTVLRLSLPNPLKPDVESRMKM